MAKNSSWAVVTFLDEGNTDEEFTSEIPSNWLINENLCYWPTTKNITALMAKEVIPDPNSEKWALYNIRLESYCDTLKHARKKAACISDSDEVSIPKGRGLRMKKMTLKAVQEQDSDNSSSSGEHNIDFSTLPEFPKTEVITRKPASSSVLESKVGNIRPIIIASCDNTPDAIENIPVDMIDVEQGNIPIDVIEPGTLADMKFFIEEKFEIVNRSMREINLNLTDFNRRLERIEQNITKSKLTYDVEDVREMVNLLPLKCTEDVTALEGLLSTNHNYKNLKIYFTNVGGANTKDNILRILRKVFTNNLAVQCSWLGQRNNFKVANLKLIECIKVSVAETFPHSDKEFENVASEWFRQGKLRLTREEKKEKENKEN